MARYNNILETIGNTPLVKLNKLAPEGINLYVKVEAFNPMGSVKDRMARVVIERAEQNGELKPGQTVIEATSGNTGIGLAMVCAQKGYPLVVTMAENFSVERRKLLRFLGAKVVLTPASEKGTGMLNKAAELAQKHGYYLCRQFENEANAEVHSATTAREIVDDFADEPLHYWVTGSGTGGTLKGVARVLKLEKPETQIIVAEPNNSPVLANGLPQPRDNKGQPSASHPHFRPHLMQGWSPDFISRLTEDAVESQWVDEVVPVDGNQSLQLCRDLACQEGIFVGISSGATLAAALKVAERSPVGTNMVCMLPDTGERYLSTPLFAEISEAMTGEELLLSQSTPGYQFDVPTDDKDTVEVETPASDATEVLDTQAQKFVIEIIDKEPVVMFALEWCEFCWSVRKLFQALGVPYYSVDLDSVAYQQDDLGGKIRAVLKQRLGSPTIPQIFVGGEYIGGSAELFDYFRQGKLFQQLNGLGVVYRKDVELEAEELLPQWLQPRKRA